MCASIGVIKLAKIRKVALVLVPQKSKKKKAEKMNFRSISYPFIPDSKKRMRKIQREIEGTMGCLSN